MRRHGIDHESPAPALSTELLIALWTPQLASFNTPVDTDESHVRQRVQPKLCRRKARCSVIDFQTRDAVALITLDNGRLNILSRAIHERLYRALLRFLRDDALKVAVLTCRPGTSFSAGDDLKEIDLPYGDEPDWAELVTTIVRNKPIIAATRGHCLGQGLVYLLLLTDIRFAAPDAKFGFPEIAKGMGGAANVTQLATYIPSTVAWRMALTGEPLNAEQAAACHLVNEVVDDAALLERALAEAHKIAAHPLAALKAEMSPIGRFGGRANPWDSLALLSEIWSMQRQ